MSTVQTQGLLFDVGEDFKRLDAAEEELMESFRAANTIKAYRCSWGTFERWCEKFNREPLPARPDTVKRFALWCLYERVPANKLITVEGHIAAIIAKHADHDLPSPVTAHIRKLLSNAARKFQQQPVKKEALQPEQVRRISNALRKRKGPLGVGVRAIRDRAVVLIGFNIGWRRSELSSVTTQDVSFHTKGIGIRLAVASKADQKAKRQRLVGVQKLADPDVCAVLALEDWLKVRGDWKGPLFNPVTSANKIREKSLSPESINDILKSALLLIGEDPKPYGAHSMRAGMITSAARNGATLPAIMDRSGHASLQVLMGYIRSEKLFDSNPLAGVL